MRSLAKTEKLTQLVSEPYFRLVFPAKIFFLDVANGAVSRDDEAKTDGQFYSESFFDSGKRGRKQIEITRRFEISNEAVSRAIRALHARANARLTHCKALK